MCYKTKGTKKEYKRSNKESQNSHIYFIENQRPVVIGFKDRVTIKVEYAILD